MHLVKKNILGPGEEDGEFVDESLVQQQTDDYEEFVDETIDNPEEVSNLFIICEFNSNIFPICL